MHIHTSQSKCMCRSATSYVAICAGLQTNQGFDQAGLVPRKQDICMIRGSGPSWAQRACVNDIMCTTTQADPDITINNANDDIQFSLV